MEYRLKSLELSILKGLIGEHLARSFIRNTLSPKLAQEEKWDHVVFIRNIYKQIIKAWNHKLFSYDNFREDFFVHGFYANRQLLSKYAMVVGVLARNHCTPDGLLLKLREKGGKRRVRKNTLLLDTWLIKKPGRRDVSEYPVVDGELEVVEIKCGRNAKLMKKQKEIYNDLIWKDVPLRMVEVRIVSFDRNRFLVQERIFTRHV